MIDKTERKCKQMSAVYQQIIHQERELPEGCIDCSVISGELICLWEYKWKFFNSLSHHWIVACI